MLLIGITGGVGAGKSTLLKYINTHYNCSILTADDIANELKTPGHACFDKIIELCGNDILTGGLIDNKKMSEKFFSDKCLINKVNDIIHPEVRKYILDTVERLKSENSVDCCFIEAALLIECGYKEVVDQMWYIFAKDADRTTRLKEQRAYSDEKIKNIFSSQLSDEDFRINSDVIIDNSKDLDYAYSQIDRRLEESNVRKIK